MAHAGIQGNYLDWVAYEYQDLNLTGVIGTGQKPTLEQIFISLSIKSNIVNDENAENQSLEPRKSSWMIFSNTASGLLTRLSKYSNDLYKRIFEPNVTDNNIIFTTKKLWKVRQALQQDDMGDILAYAIFFVLPTLGLLITSALTINQISLALLGFICVFAAVQWFRGQISTTKDYIELIVLVGITTVICIYKVYMNPQFLNTNWIGFVCGMVIGVVASYWMGIIKLPFTLHQAPPTAKEVGELLQMSDHIAILGKPGSGKSTYIQFLALTFAQAKAGNRKFRRSKVVFKRFGFKRWYLPIVIPLRKVSVYIRKTESISNLIFDAFRYEILPSEIRDDVTDKYIRLVP